MSNCSLHVWLQFLRAVTAPSLCKEVVWIMLCMKYAYRDGIICPPEWPKSVTLSTNTVSSTLYAQNYKYTAQKVASRKSLDLVGYTLCKIDLNQIVIAEQTMLLEKQRQNKQKNKKTRSGLFVVFICSMAELNANWEGPGWSPLFLCYCVWADVAWWQNQ